MFVVVSWVLTETVQKIGSIPCSGNFFTTDNLGNVYVVQADNSIEKYNPQGLRLNLGNFKIKGKLHSLDVSNPFEIYLFYKDLNRIIVTDNQLTQRGEIDMNKPELIQAAAIARSYDNGIWVFDLSDMQLKKYTKDMKLQMQSGNMRSFTAEIAEPVSILDVENKVYMANYYGLEIFDHFANHLKTIPWDKIDHSQVFEGKLYNSTNGILTSYDLSNIEKKNLTIPDSLPVYQFRITPDNLYLQRGDSIFIYHRGENK